MSEQQRERETVSRDKESIGRAQAAGAVVAALCCVWVCSPRVWGPSPASHRHRLETKTEAGQREREHRADTGVTQHVLLTSARAPDNNQAVFWKYSGCISLTTAIWFGLVMGRVTVFLPWPVNNADSKVRGNTEQPSVWSLPREMASLC